MHPLTLRVNGRELVTTVDSTESLLTTLRGHGLTGAKGGCLEGECGACSVIVDGGVVCSCLVLAAACAGREIVTVEGVVAPDLAEALVEHGAVQCGFCTPGIVVSASALLDRWSDIGEPVERAVVADGLAGNLCRCTGYIGILDAVEQTLARRLAERAT